MKACVFVVIFILMLLFPSSILSQDSIPDVRFAIFRLDWQTYEIKGYYEFEQSFRKALPEETHYVVGECYILDVPAGDFGYIRIVSGLTGKRIYEAETVWAGMGDHLYPPIELLRTDYQHGHTISQPDSIYYYADVHGSQVQADSAWDMVRDTDVIDRLANTSPYSLLIHGHFFALGGADLETAEWVVIAYTTPEAPPDMAVLALDWPQTLLTKEVPFIPEVTIHNFGTRPENGFVDVVVTQHAAVLYTSRTEFHSIPPDSSRTLYFDEWIPEGTDNLTFQLRLLSDVGLPWLDLYPENDTLGVEIELTDFPVFKIMSSLKHPGDFPLRGIPVDFDGDGDIDIIQNWRLLQNLGGGDFSEVTDIRDFLLCDDYSGIGLVEDITNDALVDILIVCRDGPIQLLAGLEDGRFRDISECSGITRVVGIWRITSFDMEGDGDVDLLLTNEDSVVIFRNSGGGHFENVTFPSGIELPDQTHALTAGDIDVDGDSDLFIVSWGDVNSHGVHHVLYINDGTGTFNRQTGPWEACGYGRDAEFVDCNNDGLLDIYLAGTPYCDVKGDRLYQNLGNLDFIDITSTTGISTTSFDIDCGDFDLDGDQDVLLDRLSDITLYVNNGDWSFSDWSRLCVGLQEEMAGLGLGSIGGARFIDLDNDGDLDVWSGFFVSMNMGVPGHVPSWDVKGDVNGDGLLNVADVIRLVNMIVDYIEPTPEQFWAADYNDDGVLNVLDVVQLVNAVLG